MIADEHFDAPDPAKNAGNITKHGLSLDDAERMDFSTADVREDHDATGERRFVAVGRLIGGPVAVLVFTYRGDNVRAISLRKADPKERRRWQST